MLNYKKLSSEFNKLLAKTTKEDLEAWVRFDRQREFDELLKNGKPIKIISTSEEIRIEFKEDLQQFASLLSLV